MSDFSFEDIGAVVATFQVSGEVKGGQVVKVSASRTVAPCTAGDKFCGVALEPRAGGAAVQVKGFVTVTCTGTLTPGWALLAADGKGGVQATAAGADDEPPVGVEVLVVSADTGSAVLCL